MLFGGGEEGRAQVYRMEAIVVKLSQVPPVRSQRFTEKQLILSKPCI